MNAIKYIGMDVHLATISRVAQTLASQRVCGFPPARTRGSGLRSP